MSWRAELKIASATSDNYVNISHESKEKQCYMLIMLLAVRTGSKGWNNRRCIVFVSLYDERGTK